MTAPRLVGVGVGPGDPELLTVAGVREFTSARRIFVPVLDTAAPGRAEAVVRAHLDPADADERIERLVFALNDPVDGPQDRRQRHWDAAAERIAAYLANHGGTAAFATLGDPAVYSTFTYLASSVRALLPDVVVATVPGITAMQAAASAAGIALVEGTESLTLVPVTREVAALERALGAGGTVVAYKGGRQLSRLREAVAASGALDRAVYAEHLGTADARVAALSAVTPSEGTPSDGDSSVPGAPYLSTVVVLPPRGGRGEQL